jgi:hypothetical protein
MLLPMCSCAFRVVPDAMDDFTIAVIGNTQPESPFSPVSPRVGAVLDSIRHENPVFTVHLGNITFGGRDWMGIRESDVARQYSEFFMLAPRAKTILYTARGDLDALNDSAHLYTRHTGKSPYYSFNYGAIHFIVLDSTDPQPGVISDAQLRWLESDLRRFREVPATLVFIHHPLVYPKNGRAPASGDLCKNPERILSLFSGSPVRAVISGHLPVFFLEKRDDLFHVSAGCGGYNKSEAYTRIPQYYLIRYNRGTLQVIEKRIQ